MSMVACKASLDAITAKLTATSSLKIYSGAQPATTLTTETGTLLASPTFSATAFPASTSGTSDGNATATANAIASDTNAAATGSAGHFRAIDGGGATTVLQGNIGTSGADLNFNTVTINAGDTVAITSFKITQQCGDGVS
jgi:hypothetical protein